MAFEERGREQTQMKVLINCCHNFLTHFRISFSLSVKFIQNYLFVFFCGIRHLPDKYVLKANSISKKK